MKKLLLILLGCSFKLFVFGQNTQSSIIVKGTVIDSATNKALNYVTAALQDSKTQLPVKSILTKDDGSFTLKVPAGKTYQLILTFIGYKNKTIPVTASINIDKIALSPLTNQLEAVSITGTKSLMTQEVDRISYNVQADPESKALTALDMMRKVPLLSVDASDNIKLKGDANYKILINGRESALMAKNPSDVLKAMPATNIEKIEVITTPPAKYDAEGLAGIINIITKKNVDQGYNIGLNGRENSVFGPAINLNGTLKQGKFGLSAYLGTGRNNNNSTNFGSTQTFFAPASILSQSGSNTNTGKFKYANAELSYEIDSLNLITGSVDGFGYNALQPLSNEFSNLTDNTGMVIQHYDLANNTTGNYLGFDIGLNYQLGFKNQKDRLFTLSYKYNYSPNKQFTDNLFLERVNYSLADNPDYQQYNNVGNRQHTFQLDYEHPLKVITIEAGVKAILRNNFSEYHVNDRDTSTNQYIANPAQTNDFSYRQNIYSIYNSYQLKLGQWTAKGGVRLEYTTVDADFSSTNSFVKQNYDNLIPSISVQRKFKTSSINLGFTERINRPGIFQLNPFVDRSNPSFINFGNPDLQPVLRHAFELTYSNFAKSSVNVGINYAFSNNSIQNVSGLEINNTNGQKDTVTATTYQNLGSNSSLGFTFNTTKEITKKLTLTVNAQLNHIWLKGEYNGRLYKNEGYTGNAFANAGYKFNKGYRFGIDAGYYSGDVNLQGQSSRYIYSSYVLSKDFLNKNATISLVANNPYSRFQTSRSSTSTVDYYQTSFNESYYRTFAIRFNYKFGKLNSEIKKNQRGINNDDVKDSGKSSGGN
jgi:hypothetical protein